MWSDILLIIIFIIINGFFAGAEIAVVTARRSHIRHLVEEGNRRAEILHKFKGDPERFLATTQLGVTLAGVIAAAIGGAIAVKTIKPLIMEIPVQPIAASSEAIALGLVTILITFFLLVFGELIPKSIALSDPERVGLRTARFVERFSKIAIVFVKILTFSTNMLA